MLVGSGSDGGLVHGVEMGVWGTDAGSLNLHHAHEGRLGALSPAGEVSA